MGEPNLDYHQTKTSRHRSAWLLLAIVILAAALRLYKLDQNPPSLYWDETSLGYNAFAILTTSHDEHGERLPLTRFIAFGDYKPPGYIYALVPFMFIFGVNEFAIRFPSAVAGIVMVVLAYFLAKIVFHDERVGLIAAAILAVSPWSLQLSRGAFEANLAAMFNALGVTLFLLSRRRRWVLPLAGLAFILSFYTFNANRIIAPLLLIFLGLLYWRDLVKHWRWVCVSLFIGAVLLWPNIAYFQTRESRLRFYEVSIFTSLDIVKKTNERIQRCGNTWWAKIIFNRRVFFTEEFLLHYLDHFKAEFLFISGDRNPRFSTQAAGEMYLLELPLLLTGLYWMLRNRNKETALVLGWLLIAPIPAGMARETPHMLRTATSLPTYQIIAAVGALTIWQWLVKQRKILLVTGLTVSVGIITLNLAYYFHNYWVHYPRDWSGEWQYGYKQMVEKVGELEGNFDRIEVTSAYGRPYIYFLLYQKINPLIYVRERSAERDWFGLWNVYGFGKFDFVGKPVALGERVLKVNIAGKIPLERKLAEIKDLKGKVVFEIGRE